MCIKLRPRSDARGERGRRTVVLVLGSPQFSLSILKIGPRSSAFLRQRALEAALPACRCQPSAAEMCSFRWRGNRGKRGRGRTDRDESEVGGNEEKVQIQIPSSFPFAPSSSPDTTFLPCHHVLTCRAVALKWRSWPRAERCVGSACCLASQPGARGSRAWRGSGVGSWCCSLLNLLGPDSRAPQVLTG